MRVELLSLLYCYGCKGFAEGAEGWIVGVGICRGSPLTLLTLSFFANLSPPLRFTPRVCVSECECFCVYTDVLPVCPVTPSMERAVVSLGVMGPSNPDHVFCVYVFVCALRVLCVCFACASRVLRVYFACTSRVFRVCASRVTPVKTSSGSFA